MIIISETLEEQKNLYPTTVHSMKIMFYENQLQKKKNSKAKDVIIMDSVDT